MSLYDASKGPSSIFVRAFLAHAPASVVVTPFVLATEPKAAIAAYEERMFQRGADAAHDSAAMLKMMISRDGSAQMAQWMREAHEGLLAN